MPPLGVSVIIPTYNRAALLPRAIRSALAACSPGDEILVVDDASTDDTPAAVAAFGEAVRYARLPHNAGAGAARNHGVRLADRPLVAFLDSDDEWAADKLALQRQLMASRPEVLFCFSDFCATFPDGRAEHRFLRHWHRDDRDWGEILGPAVAYSALGPLPPGREDFKVHTGDLFLAEMQSHYVATSTLVVRRPEAGDALRFAEDLPISEDKECFGRLAGRGPAAYLDCETSTQHGHAGPRITDAGVWELACARLTLLARVWGADAAFLARHGERYRAVEAEQHRLKAVWLLARGRSGEAREEYRLAGGAPLSHGLLLRVPGPVLRAVLRLRRAVLGRATRSPGAS